MHTFTPSVHFAAFNDDLEWLVYTLVKIHYGIASRVSRHNNRQGHDTVASICIHHKSNIIANVLHAIHPNQLLGVCSPFHWILKDIQRIVNAILN